MARRNLGFANPSGFMFVSRLVSSAKPITNVTPEGFGDSVFKWDITFYVENQVSVGCSSVALCGGMADVPARLREPQPPVIWTSYGRGPVKRACGRTVRGPVNSP